MEKYRENETAIFNNSRNVRIIFALLGMFLFLVQTIIDKKSMWGLLTCITLVTILATAYTMGVGMACIVSVWSGVVLNMITGNNGYTTMFGIIAILAGVFAPLGRIICATAFLAGAMAVGILTDAILLYNVIPALMLAMFLFFLIPQDKLTVLSQWADMRKMKVFEEERVALEKKKQEQRMKLLEQAKQWQDLADSFTGLRVERELFLQTAKNLVAKSRTRQDVGVYDMVTGVARAVGNQAYISGDNYSCQRIGKNRLMIALSDGMGTGRQAFNDSDSVISRTEMLMESGFSVDTTAGIINRWLIAQGREDVGTTLDIALVDLVSGDMNIMKAGAAATYILRRDDENGSFRGEYYESECMPLGIMEETALTRTDLHIKEGDIVVMMTDGVLDGLTGEMREERMMGFLEYEAEKCMDSDMYRAASALASAVLTFATTDSEGNFIRDDMTIVAAVMRKVGTQ